MSWSCKSRFSPVGFGGGARDIHLCRVGTRVRICERKTLSPIPLTLRPESLQQLPPPEDAGESAVLAGRGGEPERGGIYLRALDLSPSSLSPSCSVPPRECSKQQEQASEDPASGVLSPGFQVPAP